MAMGEHRAWLVSQEMDIRGHQKQWDMPFKALDAKG